MKNKESNTDLKQRLENYYGESIDEICVESTQEIDTGEPVGEEIW